MSMTRTQAANLGHLVARARHKKGLSLRQIEEQSGLSRSWLGGLEQGRSRTIDSERLARLADVLDIPAARINRVAGGAMRKALPGPRAYFRAKYDLTADEAAQVEHYIARLRGTAE